MCVNKRLFSFLLMIFSCTAFAVPFSLNQIEDGILDLSADKFEFNNTEGTIIYSGNVQGKMGNRELKSNQLIIYRNPEGQITKIVATGKPAHMHGTPENSADIFDAYANEMEYDMQKDIIYLRGNARVERGGDRYEAPEIQYDMVNEIVSSSSEGRNRTHITIDAKTLENKNL